jgi:hypothetical protein
LYSVNFIITISTDSMLFGLTHIVRKRGCDSVADDTKQPILVASSRRAGKGHRNDKLCIGYSAVLTLARAWR